MCSHGLIIIITASLWLSLAGQTCLLISSCSERGTKEIYVSWWTSSARCTKPPYLLAIQWSELQTVVMNVTQPKFSNVATSLPNCYTPNLINKGEYAVHSLSPYLLVWPLKELWTCTPRSLYMLMLWHNSANVSSVIPAGHHKVIWNTIHQSCKGGISTHSCFLDFCSAFTFSIAPIWNFRSKFNPNTASGLQKQLYIPLPQLPAINQSINLPADTTRLVYRTFEWNVSYECTDVKSTTQVQPLFYTLDIKSITSEGRGSSHIPVDRICNDCPWVY